MLPVERDAVLLVVQALGDACRKLRDEGEIDSPWHHRFTHARHGLLKAMTGWAASPPDVDETLTVVDRRRHLRVVPSQSQPQRPSSLEVRPESA